MTKNLIENEKIQEQKMFPEHILLRYLYTGDGELLEQIGEYGNISQWNAWKCAVLVEIKGLFFDREEENCASILQKELRRNFFYMNLNARQSLLLFSDTHCDYRLVSNQIYTLLRRRYPITIYLAVSRRFEGCKELPVILRELERQMEEMFYHPDSHIFFCEEDELEYAGKEVQDYNLVQKIAEDVSRKDVEQLRKHFHVLEEKYRENTTFSAMYVKFVFSNVIQEIFQERKFSEYRQLSSEIDRLYSSSSLKEILQVVKENIQAYITFIQEIRKESMDEVEIARSYIREHCQDELSLEMLVKKVQLPPGYFSFVFGKEMGMSPPRFQHMCRMEKARDLMVYEKKTKEQAARETGFRNLGYFSARFLDYFGFLPEEAKQSEEE